MFSEIYPNFSESEIQLFKDREDAKGFAEHFPVGLKDKEYILNKNREGMGVFFTINQMKKGMCSKDGVLGINAWAVDIDEKDGLSKTDQFEIIYNSPVIPSLVVESKGGYHVYFFANKGTIEGRSHIQKIICDYFNGDYKIVTDTSRVLRLPGYAHNKGEPFMVSYMHIGDYCYTEKEMINGFDGKFSFKAEIAKKLNRKFKPGSLEGLIKKPEKKEFISNEEGLFEKVRRSNQMDLLQRLSGSSAVSGESYEFAKNGNGTYQIIINGKSSGNWIDNQYNIGSKAKEGKDGGPTVIEWLKYYGHSFSEIHSILKNII